MFSSLQTVFTKVSNQKNLSRTLQSSHVVFKFEQVLKEFDFDCKVFMFKNDTIYLEIEDNSLKQAIYFNKEKIIERFTEVFPEVNLKKINFIE